MSRFVVGKSCLLCGGPIISRGPKRDAAAIYCSRQHRIDHHKMVSAAEGRGLLTKTCENPDCGKEFTYYASMRPQATYCSIRAGRAKLDRTSLSLFLLNILG